MDVQRLSNGLKNHYTGYYQNLVVDEINRRSHRFPPLWPYQCLSLLHPNAHYYSQVNVREKYSHVAEWFRHTPSWYEIIGCKPCLRRAYEALT